MVLFALASPELLKSSSFVLGGFERDFEMGRDGKSFK